jgi:hypothetical protein
LALPKKSGNPGPCFAAPLRASSCNARTTAISCGGYYELQLPMSDNPLNLKHTSNRWVSMLLIALMAMQSLLVFAEESPLDPHSAQQFQSSLDDEPEGESLGAGSSKTGTLDTGETETADCCQCSQCCHCHGSLLPLAVQAVRLSPTPSRHLMAAYHPDLHFAQPSSIYRPPIA